jgi:protein-S-isoprenylcysteine O-methyltransferase Ste14
MDNNWFFILVTVCVSAHLIRLIYEILKHKKLLKASKLTFIIVFSDMAILWISWFLLCSLDIYKIDLPAFVRYAGITLVSIGALAFFIGLYTIKTLESYEGDLITKGIYSKIRHPMYVGFIFWLIGFPIFWGALFSFFLSLILIANVLFWRYLEEKELEKRFVSYKDYKKKTWF